MPNPLRWKVNQAWEAPPGLGVQWQRHRFGPNSMNLYAEYGLRALSAPLMNDANEPLYPVACGNSSRDADKCLRLKAALAAKPGLGINLCWVQVDMAIRNTTS